MAEEAEQITVLNCRKCRRPIQDVMWILLILAYAVYYVYALYFDFSNNPVLMILTVFGIVAMIIYIFYYNQDILHVCRPARCITYGFKRLKIIIGRFLAPMIVFGFVIFVLIDALTKDTPNRLISGVGLIFIVFIAFVLSAHPSKIRWKNVLDGIATQMTLGLIILRWDAGFAALGWLGKQVASFLSYSDIGAEFVFGESFLDHSMAMQSMPVAIYFGAVNAILYYYGIIQVAIRGIGKAIQMVMGTGAVESFVAASNIFLGPTESVLTIGPLLSKMTKAELHSVLSCGFSTISGAVLAMYISFGVSPSHLLTASVMSAPAALAISRVLLPEVESSVVAKADDVIFEKRKEKNIIEAASAGASECIPVVGYIMVNLLSFTAVVEFLNKTLSWFGDRVGLHGITFQRVCGFLLWPIAFLLGVEWQDCEQVGQMIASAVIINSFFSFIELANLISNRKMGLSPTISKRSETIVTYAVCNFANFGSIGMNIGAMGAIAPDRKADLANVAVRALVAGNMASFMTACISGLILDH